jgi:hypothetical protein
MEYIIAVSAACLFFCLAAYVIGVHQGKVYERAEITRDFQLILQRLLHMAAEQNYKGLHMFLQDLCDDNAEALRESATKRLTEEAAEEVVPPEVAEEP